SCKITENQVYGMGGGIKVFESILYLSGTSVHHNKSRNGGGGIAVGGFINSNHSMVYFNNQILCNIYNNLSDRCNDFIKGVNTPYIEVVVDTFTVANPDVYYLAHIAQSGVPQPDLIGISMQNNFFDSIESDLFVSPDGDNNNSGLSEEEPLQTIAHALNVIEADSLNHRTLHLANGVYSESLNNQWFPINAKGYVSIIGESMGNTIIDAVELSGFIHDREGELDYEIKNITLQNSIGSIFHCSMYFNDPYNSQKNVTFENVKIKNSKVEMHQLAMLDINVQLKGVIFQDNFGGSAISFNNNSTEKVLLENCRIINNQQWNHPRVSKARPLNFNGISTNDSNDFPEYTIINSEINNCGNQCWEWSSSPGAIFTLWNSKINIINCTIADNSTTASLGAAINGHYENSIMNIYNSIIYGNTPRQITITNEYADESGPYILNISHSLIQEGETQVCDAYGGNEINWLGGNLREDPLWFITDENRYFLSENSPCIDVGTLNLPEGIELPEFDLAGNPRIYGDGIDMGAYEWNPNQSIYDDEITIINNQFKSSNYPNPFNPITT
ncbi:MAG: choice-of-anchor Q domain-containing protein, partial [Candidatus Cloacimonadota bacterium]|nr:choice-of-anchor Q domain-containing protein [Candidatus Cloacimonadota bacterium]